MGRYNLWYILLMSFTFSSYSTANTGQQLVKTIRKEADFTPVCDNATLNVTIFVECRIRPVRSSEEECNLTYHRIIGFKQGCDSRFSLIPINQTLFLQLNNLTPKNSGNYTCQCTARHGTFLLQLNITVVDNEDPTLSTGSSAVAVVLVLIFISITGLILGVVYRHIGKHLEPLTWHELNSTSLYKEAEEAELYHFRQEEIRLYSTVKVACCQTIYE